MVSSCIVDIGMNDVWIVQGNRFTTGYVNLAVKRRLTDIYLQQWYEDKQKNSFYNTLKDGWNMEYHLTNIDWGRSHIPCIMGSGDQREFPPSYKCHWESPGAALTAGK